MDKSPRIRRTIFVTNKHGALFNKNSRISLRINLHRYQNVSSFRSGTRRLDEKRPPYVTATDFKNGQPRSLLFSKAALAEEFRPRLWSSLAKHVGLIARDHSMRCGRIP